MLDGLTLSPLVSTGLFVLAVVAGYQYRRAWKAEGPRWRLWASGLIAAACLSAVAFIPVQPG